MNVQVYAVPAEVFFLFDLNQSIRKVKVYEITEIYQVPVTAYTNFDCKYNCNWGVTLTVTKSVIVTVITIQVMGFLTCLKKAQPVLFWVRLNQKTCFKLL